MKSRHLGLVFYTFCIAGLGSVGSFMHSKQQDMGAITLSFVLVLFAAAVLAILGAMLLLAEACLSSVAGAMVWRSQAMITPRPPVPWPLVGHAPFCRCFFCCRCMVQT